MSENQASTFGNFPHIKKNLLTALTNSAMVLMVLLITDQTCTQLMIMMVMMLTLMTMHYWLRRSIGVLKCVENPQK